MKLPKGKNNPWNVQKKTPKHRAYEAGKLAEAQQGVLDAVMSQLVPQYCMGQDEDGDTGALDRVEDIMVLAQYGANESLAGIQEDQMQASKDAIKGVMAACQVVNSRAHDLYYAKQVAKEEYVCDFMHDKKGNPPPTGHGNTSLNVWYRDI